MSYCKIVRVENDEKTLVSAVAPEKAKQIYEPNVWTKGPKWLAKRGYHLTVFLDLDYAETFIQDTMFPVHWKMEVWECEIRDVIKPMNIPRRYCYKEDIRHWISFDKETVATVWYWPAGTCMAKEVKLTRRIK